ncbi:MAG: DNA alkylation repair protein [Candidatus Saccharimonadales bacterium]|jgi:3-methyladenine DNA glycosylase AlkD
MVEELRVELKKYVDPEKAAFFPRFFKTGVGEYGEGDEFMGITVPNTRIVAKKFAALPLADIEQLLRSEWHEERFLALIIMVNQFKKAWPDAQRELYQFYLSHTKHVNNWDLVDTSARDIVGGYVYHHQESLPVLDQLAGSKILWERRIAIIATYYFLMKGEPDVTIKLAKTLLHDDQDLMHKAVGWMLREMGKRCDRQLLIDFLNQHAHEMPRTTLRYAIEHFDQQTRRKYLEI